MALYSVKIDGLVTGATANTYATLIGMKFANTTGHRARLRRLVIGGGGGAAQDVAVSVRIGRTDNTTDGTSTAVNVNTIGKHEAESVASNVVAIGKNHSVEPTSVSSANLGGGEINARGTLVLEWLPGEGPFWGKNETLVIQGAPGTDVAVNLGAALTWEE